MNPISVIWIVIICIAGLLPTSPLGVPWDDQWDANYANYAPLVLGVVIGRRRARLVEGAQSHFTGQVRNIDEPVARSSRRSPTTRPTIRQPATRLRNVSVG